jgi:hypothetical protein
MVKNQNAFAKRQREMEKKAKAETKRLRRSKRKLASDEDSPDAVEKATAVDLVDPASQIENELRGKSS